MRGYSGIPPEIQDKIFDAFFSTKKSRRKGCGLGLSVVQAIVEDHRGYLDLESEVGRGTTFSIYLPVTAERPRDVTMEEVRGGTEMVLVVDDDQVHRTVAGELLHTLGYRVAAVDSGEAAVEHLKTERADLMVLDVRMPCGMDGVETYRRALEVWPGQKAILVSGFSESERIQEARSLGVGDYLRKPLTLEKLAKAVRRELDRSLVLQT